MSNVLLVFICVIGGFGIGALLTMLIMRNSFKSKIFDCDMSNNGPREEINEMENALVLIGNGEILKREMVALAKKALKERPPF